MGILFFYNEMSLSFKEMYPCAINGICIAYRKDQRDMADVTDTIVGGFLSPKTFYSLPNVTPKRDHRHYLTAAHCSVLYHQTQQNMNTQSTDTQLEYELQDLYISSRHWLSDISFVLDETRFLHEVLTKYIEPDEQNAQGARLHHCKMMLYHQQSESIALKIRVIAYLNFLGPYIVEPGKKTGIDLIEQHTAIEKELMVLLESLKLLKAELFPFVEQVIR